MSGETGPAIDKSLRFAASMVLLRDAADGLEVFMVERHRRIEFSSGALVFPGGSLDRDDAVVAARPEFYGGANGLDEAALGLRIAAVRETFEESGHLLARPRGSTETVPAERMRDIERAHRAALAEGRAAFSDILAQESLVLALDLLVPFAHWITPLQEPKRFDTYFFMAAAPSGQVGQHDGHELVNSLWLSPCAAIEADKAGRFKVVFPTMRNLIKLGRYPNVATALQDARARPVVTVLPEMTIGEDTYQLRIPAEAGYDGEVFELPRLSHGTAAKRAP